MMPLEDRSETKKNDEFITPVNNELYDKYSE